MTIRIRYGIDVITKNYSESVTVGDVMDDPNIKAGLGFGDNVKGLINGVEVDEDVTIGDGQELVLETRSNAKAQENQTVKVRYGVDSIERSFPYGCTVGTVIQNANVKAVLGYGDSVKVLFNGVQLSASAVVPNGALLVLETRSNTKAN